MRGRKRKRIIQKIIRPVHLLRIKMMEQDQSRLIDPSSIEDYQKSGDYGKALRQVETRSRQYHILAFQIKSLKTRKVRRLWR